MIHICFVYLKDSHLLLKKENVRGLFVEIMQKKIYQECFTNNIE